MSMRGIGSTIKHRAMEHTVILMDPLILVNGRPIKRKAMGLRRGPMAVNMRVSMLMDSNMEGVFLRGQMGVCIQGNLKRMTYKVQVPTFGLIKGNIQDHGRI